MVFCSCGLLDAARAQQPAAPRTLPVAVNGKRVKTIDVHAHCLIPEATKLLGQDAYKHHTGGIVMEDRCV